MGKPSRGTPADKRLAENKTPAMKPAAAKTAKGKGGKR